MTHLRVEGVIKLTVLYGISTSLVAMKHPIDKGSSSLIYEKGLGLTREIDSYI